MTELRNELHALEKGDIGAINYQLEKLRLERKRLALEGEDTVENIAFIEKQEKALDAEYQLLKTKLNQLHMLLSGIVHTLK